MKTGRKWRFIILVLAFLPAGTAQADMVTLGQFDALGAAENGSSERIMHGMYLIAVADALVAANVVAQRKIGHRLFCLPEELTLTPELVKKQVATARRAFVTPPKTPLALLAGLAVAEAFPC